MPQDILRVNWRDYADLASRATNRGRFRILAEGDSWFSFSIKSDALDGQVVRLSKAPVIFVDIATPGDTAEKLFQAPRKNLVYRVMRSAVAAKRPFDLLLLSAGGNDLLGNLLDSYIVKNPLGPSEPSDWIDTDVLDALLEQVKHWYSLLIEVRDEESPETHILLHTYDYPQKIGSRRITGGPWIAPVLDQAPGLKGNLGLQKKVMKEVVDRLYQYVLSALVSNTVSLVDLRGTLATRGPWFDEIHPDANGYEELALKYQPTLGGLFPSVF